jgi:hypothetical protein
MAGTTGLEPAASAVTGQRSTDNRKSDLLVNAFLSHGFLSADPGAKHISMASKFV